MLKLPSLFAVLILALSTENPAARGGALEIEEATGLRGGVAVVLDSSLETAAELAETGRFVVHLLPPRGDDIPALRNAIARRGLAGRVVLGPPRFTSTGRNAALPHPARFVNLLVADLDRLPPGVLPAEERRRVLATRGAAYLRSEGAWRVERSEPDDRIDDWTHRWYAAAGNCLSRDRLAAFPRGVQWQHGPAMEDGTADGKIPRIAAGYWVLIDSSSGDLLCRDAGNGTLLWRRPLQLSPRDDLAVVDRRIYLYHEPAEGERDRRRPTPGPLVAIDLATGELAREYAESLRAGTAHPIDYHDPDENRPRRETPVPWFVVNEEVIVQAYEEHLVVLDRATGRRRFTHTLADATWFSPVARGDLLIAAEALTPARRGRHDGSNNVRAVVAFSLRDGRPLWRNEEPHPRRELQEKERSFVSRAEFKPMSLADDLLLLHASSYQFRQGGSLAVLEASTGRELWRREFAPKERYTQGSQRGVIRGGEVVLLDGLGALRFEARTGKPLGEPLTPPREPRRLARANGACTASRATLDWLICNAYLYVGPEGEPLANFGARGACGQGVIPANGAIYVPPTPCDCGDYLRGHLALAPESAGEVIEDESRLVTGPAYGRVAGEAPSADKPSVEWSTFLGDPRRGSTGREPPAGKLVEHWSRRVAAPREDALEADRRFSEYHLGALSAPVAAAGLVLVAAPESHEVVALAADSGAIRWRFLAGGKVDSPPTLAGGFALFGCDDGSLYALRAADGELAWRFRAAPREAVSLRHGHLASPFPLPGSVLVEGDRVFAVAGHHTDLGGLHAWSLELATGRPLARRAIFADQPRVVTNDVAVADRESTGFWIGPQLHLAWDLSVLPPTNVEGTRPPLAFDRNGARLRFRTQHGRGGSTHAWKGAMQVPGRNRWLRGHRLALGESLAVGLRDPENPRHATPILWGVESRAETDAEPRWTRHAAELGEWESYGALLLAGDRLYLGGGSRDGRRGVLHVLEARSGSLLQTLELPARVTECGLALAEGRLLAACEDGRVTAFAGE